MSLTPDFDVPADANMDNSYEVQVSVASGEDDRQPTASADFTITVIDDETEVERVLVSNTGQGYSGSTKVNNSDSAVRIRTGPNSQGYTIHSLALEFSESLADPTGVKVSSWSSHTPNRYERPKNEIFAFTNPSSIQARLTEFTAPPDTVLEPDTSYWIMVERTGDEAIKLLKTRSNSEDAFSAAGWSIGAHRFHRPRNINGQWTNRRVDHDPNQLMLRVIGYEYPGR